MVRVSEAFGSTRIGKVLVDPVMADDRWCQASCSLSAHLEPRHGQGGYPVVEVLSLGYLNPHIGFCPVACSVRSMNDHW